MQLKPKLKATSIHLALSSVIFLIALYLIVVEWYPGFLFLSDGGWQGVRIMVGVDLVLGPLLTFIIYNPLKTRRAILFDFTCIGIVQTAALIWGFYTVHGERPVALVHWDQFIHPITAKSLRAQGKGLEVLEPYGDRNPRLIFAKPPEDAETQIQLFMDALNGEMAEYEQVKLFQPLAPYMTLVAKKQKDIAKLAKRIPEVNAALEALKAGRDDAPEWVYISFIGKYDNRVLVFSKGGELVGALPGDPDERFD